ncbi:MAG TPA: polysaccharide deacetylase family protein [Beijerinckia sp.]|jgi:peptidoglycan/xylan/chitin deacetylase (PgdA/CDA1 family)|nr:polysaccharide deacetylase family protein [Beijerinckia sp.]
MTTKLILKRTLGKVARLRPTAAQRKLILLYHSIGESPWATPENDFRAQMEWLSRSAKIVSLPQLLEDSFDDPFQVSITFDDGYASLRDLALPVLQDCGAVATVFINAGLLAENVRNPSDASLGHYPEDWFLSWEDVRALAAAGWTIGSHGVEHLDLTRAAPDVVNKQLRASKQMIGANLSQPCSYFAYTWGRHVKSLREAVAAAGYNYALSCEHEPLSEGFDRWAVPRINISNDYSLEDFAALAVGDWDYLGWFQKMRARR